MLVVPQSTVTSSVAPRSGERADRLDVGAVAFENPVRDMHDRIAAAEPHEARQQRRGGRAVDVVVAEDRDLLAAQHRVGDALRRLLHRGDGVRVGHQPPDGRIEERLDLVDLDAAAGEDARQQLGHVVPLRDRKRARRRPLVEPVAPGPAADRALDVEEQRVDAFGASAKATVMEPYPNRDRETLYGAAHRVRTRRGVATIHRACEN